MKNTNLEESYTDDISSEYIYGDNDNRRVFPITRTKEIYKKYNTDSDAVWERFKINPHMGSL